MSLWIWKKYKKCCKISNDEKKSTLSAASATTTTTTTVVDHRSTTTRKNFESVLDVIRSFLKLNWNVVPVVYLHNIAAINVWKQLDRPTESTATKNTNQVGRIKSISRGKNRNKWNEMNETLFIIMMYTILLFGLVFDVYLWLMLLFLLLLLLNVQ